MDIVRGNFVGAGCWGLGAVVAAVLDCRGVESDLEGSGVEWGASVFILRM